MKKANAKLAHLIYDFIQKGPHSLREVFLEFEKVIEPDRATRCYNHTVRKADRDRARQKSLEHRIFHGKKRIIIKAVTDLVRRGVVEKLDNKKVWDRIYKSTGKQYITRGHNMTTQAVVEMPVMEPVADEKVASAKDTHFKISLPILPLPKADD